MMQQRAGGLITIGYQDDGNPLELKVYGGASNDLCERLAAV